MPGFRVSASLIFEVRAADGRVLDRFAETDLTCVALGHPEKAWNEAACWAHIAIVSDRRAREPEAVSPSRRAEQSDA